MCVCVFVCVVFEIYIIYCVYNLRKRVARWREKIEREKKREREKWEDIFLNMYIYMCVCVCVCGFRNFYYFILFYTILYYNFYYLYEKYNIFLNMYIYICVFVCVVFEIFTILIV